MFDLERLVIEYQRIIEREYRIEKVRIDLKCKEIVLCLNIERLISDRTRNKSIGNSKSFTTS